MYNSKFICTYKDYPDLDMSDTMYRRDLLYAFGINDLDFEKNEIEITKEIFNLFNKMSEIEKIKTASKMTTSFFITHDLEYGFMALFSYNFFDIIHPCICEFLDKEEISDDKLELLILNLAK